MKKNVLTVEATNNLLDVVLRESASIMYTRQATYYYLLRVNGWTRKKLHQTIKARANAQNIPYNKGVTQKESSVAEYAILNLKSCFSSVVMDRENPEACIEKIAGIMQQNKIAYNHLKLEIVKSPTDSGNKQESTDSTDSSLSGLTLADVITFIKQAKYADCLLLADVVADAIKKNVDKIHGEKQAEKSYLNKRGKKAA